MIDRVKYCAFHVVEHVTCRAFHVAERVKCRALRAVERRRSLVRGVCQHRYARTLEPTRASYCYDQIMRKLWFPMSRVCMQTFLIIFC